MVSERQALSAWQDVLQEAIGVDEAALVVDRMGDVVTRQDLTSALDRLSVQFDAKLDRLSSDFRAEVDAKLESQANRLMAAWRRDLLLIAVPQFVALVAILMGVGG